MKAFVQRTPLSSVVVAAAHRGEAAQHSTQHTAHRGDKCFRSGAGFGQNSEKRRGTGRDCTWAAGLVSAGALAVPLKVQRGSNPSVCQAFMGSALLVFTFISREGGVERTIWDKTL